MELVLKADEKSGEYPLDSKKIKIKGEKFNLERLSFLWYL